MPLDKMKKKLVTLFFHKFVTFIIINLSIAEYKEFFHFQPCTCDKYWNIDMRRISTRPRLIFKAINYLRFDSNRHIKLWSYRVLVQFRPDLNDPAKGMWLRTAWSRSKDTLWGYIVAKHRNRNRGRTIQHAGRKTGHTLSMFGQSLSLSSDFPR